MNTNRNTLAILVVIIVCSVLVWLSASIEGSQKTYEIHPNIAMPEYKTDLTRITDAYERLMERYMNLTERNLSAFGTDLNYVATKLDSIDGQLIEMSARIARIETALGIEQPKSPPIPKPPAQP
jgi:Na+/phosphate symporter